MANAMLVLGLFDWPNHAIHKLFLWIDSGVYWLASECYQLFIKLASTKIFEDEFFSNFANRIYAILGIFMLFYLAYALLTALVDPEKIKGDKGVSKIATNLVISLVMLGFLPSVFTYAYRLQNYVLSSNLIGSLVLGTPLLGTDTTDENHEAMLKYGDVLSFSVLNTFLNSENINVNLGQLSNGRDYNWFDLKADILENSNYSKMVGLDVAVSTGANEITKNGNSDGELKIVDYKPLLSTATGILLIYVLFSFTLDLGKRVVLFAFYQLIAPIPVILRVIPGKKATFDKYLKQTISIYAQVFMEVAAMYIAIYFINEIAHSNTLGQFFQGGIQGMLAFAIILMGILVVAKELPKKIADLFGLDAGNFKLGIKDKLKAGGFFAGGAMLGAGLTGITQNASAALGKIGNNLWNIGSDKANAWRNTNSWWEKGKILTSGIFSAGASTAKGLATGALSSLAGGTSGMFNAYGKGKDAKGFKDMQKAASAGATTAYQNRLKRANYVARNNGLAGAMASRVVDVAGAAKKFATGTGWSDILTSIAFKDGFVKEFDEYKNIYNTPEYQAMESQQHQYEAMLAANPDAVDRMTGQRIDAALTHLKNNMRNKRATAIKKNEDAAAYVAYNLARYAQENYTEFKKSGLNFNGADINDFVLRGDKVYHKDGSDVDTNDLLKMFENLDVSDYTVSGNDITINTTQAQLFDSSGNVVGTVSRQLKDDSGSMNQQVRDAKKQLRADKQSAAYKEAQKKKDAEKK